ATYAMAAYQGTLYAIAESSGHVYSSTTGASWTDLKDLNTVSAVTSLRSITVYNGLLIIGAGDSGKLFSFDGTTWSLWTTITNATAVKSLLQYDWGSSPKLYAGASNVDGLLAAATGRATLFSISVTGSWGSGSLVTTPVESVPYPHIEALGTINGATFYGAVDDTTAVQGALSQVGSARLVATLQDNAVA